jgi:hypothetical protein
MHEIAETPEHIRREGIDFVTNSSTPDQLQLFAQLEQNRERTGQPQQQYQRAENGIATLSEKEIIRALETAARTGERWVDLDSVQKELREEERNPGPRGLWTRIQEAEAGRTYRGRDNTGLVNDWLNAPDTKAEVAILHEIDRRGIGHMIDAYYEKFGPDEITTRGGSTKVSSFKELRTVLRDSERQTEREAPSRSTAQERADRGEFGSSKPSLYDRYKAERQETYAQRKEAEQGVYRSFESYRRELGSFYAVQHEEQKLAVQRGSVRRQGHEILKAEHGRDRVEAHQLRSQQLAAARQAHPVLTWESFLKREAQRGDKEAEKALTRHDRSKDRGREHGRGD